METVTITKCSNGYILTTVNDYSSEKSVIIQHSMEEVLWDLITLFNEEGSRYFENRLKIYSLPGDKCLKKYEELSGYTQEQIKDIYNDYKKYFNEIETHEHIKALRD